MRLFDPEHPLRVSYARHCRAPAHDGEHERVPQVGDERGRGRCTRGETFDDWIVGTNAGPAAQVSVRNLTNLDDRLREAGVPLVRTTSGARAWRCRGSGRGPGVVSTRPGGGARGLDGAAEKRCARRVVVPARRSITARARAAMAKRWRTTRHEDRPRGSARGDSASPRTRVPGRRRRAATSGTRETAQAPRPQGAAQQLREPVHAPHLQHHLHLPTTPSGATARPPWCSAVQPLLRQSGRHLRAPVPTRRSPPRVQPSPSASSSPGTRSRRSSPCSARRHRQLRPGLEPVARRPLRRRSSPRAHRLAVDAVRVQDRHGVAGEAHHRSFTDAATITRGRERWTARIGKPPGGHVPGAPKDPKEATRRRRSEEDANDRTPKDAPGDL